MKIFTKSMALLIVLFFAATNFINAQSILCVDRDGSFEAPDALTDDWQFLQPALDELGYDYDYFEVEDLTLDGPDEATMAEYSMVFWFTGEAWSGGGTMTVNDEFNLLLYLQLDGGTLLLSAQDYLWDRYPDFGTFTTGMFPYDVLGITEVVQDVWQIEPPEFPDSANIVGSAGSFAEGMAFTVIDIYTEETDDGLYIDNIIEHQGEDLLGIIFPDPEGIAAYQFDAGAYKVIFSTMSYAAIVDLEDRTELLFRSIGWLHGTTGVSTLKMDQTDIVVYPNPATTSVQIGCKYIMEEMWIMNSTGQVVDHFDIGHNKVKINISSYDTGIYFVEVKTDNGVITSKLVVE